jgi:nucleotide-binding universal stress UspA family protein
MRYLLPVDGSPASIAAVRHAIALRLAGLPMEVVLANAQEAPHLYEVVLAPDPELLDRASESAGHHALEAAGQMLRGAHLPFTEVVVHGEPARVLPDLVEAHGCQGVIVGAGEPGLIDAGRLGSVAQALLHRTGVPVTVVHAPEAAD